MVMSEEARKAQREYMRKWREKNRDRYNDTIRNWKKNNPDKVKEHKERFYLKQLEKMKAE